MSFKRLLLISRPIFYLPVILTYLCGVLYSGAQNWLAFLVFSILVVPLLCLVTFGLNDIYDIDSDIINLRKGGVYGAKLSKYEIPKLLSYLVFASLICLVAFLILGLYAAALTLAAVIGISFAYSVPPIRLKSRPIIDSLSNGLAVVLIFLCGYWSVMIANTNLPKISLLASIFLISSTLHAIFAVVDYDTDKQLHEMTIAIYLGKTKTILLIIGAIITSALLLIFGFSPSPELLLTVLYVISFALIFGLTYLYRPEKLKSNIVMVIYMLPILIAVNLFLRYIS